MANLFSLRATNPKDMLKHPEPVGPENDKWIKSIVEDAGLIVAMWGNHGTHLDRAETVSEMLRSMGKDLCCLGLNKNGEPKHPLYLPANAKPGLWKMARG